MIEKKQLEQLYIENKKSMQEIADYLDCSVNKVRYWMEAHGVKSRNISDAVYLKSNPNGDPFEFKKPGSKLEWMLLGFGLGLFWGEGTKASKNSVRLGNSDPGLLRKFIQYLEVIYGVDRNQLRFGLQLFTDCSEHDALKYWQKHLNAKPDQFQKVVKTPSRKPGTYRKKSLYGVVTVYFHNTKLRNLIQNHLVKYGGYKPS
ncbi:MAG: hypothetical protein HOJ15_02005 [Candidatus Jacksonbacteria bacterium]|jgi:hypothetical protein|nr:hypothetical protein [Candidatus Jacksonbacteria bacterium]MBT6034024.1 hypothetical protein [Candidatus Jacksonbacteria bacterium]MBT6301178.1 hypothetical protein [Candidatus Jacksonbacteria bacterium]MBT6757651.1 hypothetical protein [Candidatus Jacksonbacteria bacterium]MBT6954750.1 hypothetical protein [Candidatus Jacksonbacteria bacterium]